jgi:RNA polymerase sigma factor (sigma-70 family)
MNRDHDRLAEQFEENRAHLRTVAHRMLGSLSEADDAVQDAWLRASRAGSDVENIGGWLTTVVARVCLNVLRSRRSRREESLETPGVEPAASADDGTDPEHEAVLADSVGIAMLVVLDTLSPAERIAFVLHDTFGVPFEDIAAIVDRSPAATRQLASRARRRVRRATPTAGSDLDRQREVVGAFMAAARGGDFQRLLAVLDPEVVLYADAAAVPAGRAAVLRGATAVAKGAVISSERARFAGLALIDGAVGIVFGRRGRLFGVLGFTVHLGKVVRIDVIADPERLRSMDIGVLDLTEHADRAVSHSR